MAQMQRNLLRRQLLAKFPKGSKLKHYRSGGFANMRTYVDVLSDTGAVLMSESGHDLESTLRSMLEKLQC